MLKRTLSIRRGKFSAGKEEFIEDYALLFGTLFLFVILAVVMYSTRKINWYSPLQ